MNPARLLPLLLVACAAPPPPIPPPQAEAVARILTERLVRPPGPLVRPEGGALEGAVSEVLERRGWSLVPGGAPPLRVRSHREGDELLVVLDCPWFTLGQAFLLEAGRAPRPATPRSLLLKRP